MIIRNLFVKKFRLIILISLIVFVISVISVYFIAKSRRTQTDTKNSLEQGFGYYSNEESLGCFSKTGKCSVEGVETTIQYCKPHPQTGNGCIDDKGNQTFNTIIRKRPCKIQCTASKFTTEDGIRVKDPSVSYLGTSIPVGITSLGCDNIIDKKFGINYTNFFLGNFNDKTPFKYELKSCIPNDKNSPYTGYYQKVSTCLTSDGKGSNSCKIVCGRDSNILNLNGFANAKLNKKLINYFPTEINEEGDIRNVCYDVNNVDQIELLNYPGKIPSNFVYPEKCYKHTNVKDFDADIWPNTDGVNIFKLNKIQNSEDVSYIDFRGEDITTLEKNIFGTIIGTSYDLNNNQNSYVKLRIGQEQALLEKVYPVTTSGISLVPGSNYSNVTTDTYYLYLETNNSDLASSAKNNIIDSILATGNPNLITTSDSEEVLNKDAYFSSNREAYVRQYFIDSGDTDFLFPCSIDEFFIDIDSNYYLAKNSDTIVKINSQLSPGISLTPDTSEGYFYMIARNNTTKINQHVFKKGKVTAEGNSATITFSGTSVFDTYNDISIEKIYGSNETMLGLSVKPSVTFSGDPLGNETFHLNFEKSFFTSTVFIKDTKVGSSVAANYNFLEIKKSVNELIINNGTSAYSVFATSPLSQATGYNFPMYLQNPEPQGTSYVSVALSEFPGTSFYTLKDPPEDELTSNYYHNQSYYNDIPLRDFNEEILTSSATYSNNYFIFNGEKRYFLIAEETINSGRNYSPGLYNIYNKKFSKGYNLNLSGVCNENKAGVSSFMGIIYNGPSDPIKTIKIIRGNGSIVSGGTGSNLTASENQAKVREYFRMISLQGFSDNIDENIIFEPEKNMSIIADFSVFKSPYTINSDSTKNYLCYQSNGRARPEGYISEVTTSGSKVYTNIACPNSKVDYEVDTDDPYCGVKGIEKKLIGSTGTSIAHCVQSRDSRGVNYLGQEIEVTINDYDKLSQSCVISKDNTKYNIINNQLGFGLQLVDIVKGKKFNGEINNDVKTYPSYFTKELIEGKLYRPGEEFYIEKKADNYYVSLSNFNTNFVDNIETWRRVFPFQNNTPVSPYQYYFDFQTADIVKNTTNESLGKFPDTFIGLTLNKSSDTIVSFSTSKAGVNSQSYLDQGITYFYGGCRRGIYTLYGTPATDAGSSWQLQIEQDYIANLQTAAYRTPYSNLNTPNNIYPGYSRLKSIDGIGTSLQTVSPIFSNFGVVKSDKIVFTSRFHDPNLDVPFSPKVKPGDLFNPDFSYFNSFIYSFILGNNKSSAPYIKIPPGGTAVSRDDMNTELLAIADKYCSALPSAADPDPTNPRTTTVTNSLKTYGTFGKEFYTSEILQKVTCKTGATSEQPSPIEIPNYTTSSQNIFGEGILKEIFLNPYQSLSGSSFTSCSGTSPSFEESASGCFVNFYPPYNISSSLKDLFTVNNGTLDFYVINGFNDPKVSDYILFIPVGDSFFETKYVGDETRGSAFNETAAPYVNSVNTSEKTAPVLAIKRILKVITDKTDNTKRTITLEQKDYTNFTEPYGTGGGEYYIINLGKEITKQNIISREFKIIDIGKDSITPLTPDDTNPSDNLRNDYSYTKKFIEFEFEIESISQKTMSNLLNLYNTSQQTINNLNNDKQLTGVTGQKCYDNVVFTENTPANVLSDAKDAIKKGGINENTVACFQSGCMPGNDGGLGSLAVCLGTSGGPDSDKGWTSFQCPGNKWWYCPGNATDTNIKISPLDKGNNFLTPSISARYIKTSFQSPYQYNPTALTYATLNSSVSDTLLTTKVMGMCTEIAYNMEDDGKSYYFSEFREDKNYFEKQVPRTFSKGDTFLYYAQKDNPNEQQGKEISSSLKGDKFFEEVLEFRVNEVGVTVKNKGSSFYESGFTNDLYIDYDYKCTLVTNKDPEDVAANYFKIYNVETKNKQNKRLACPTAKTFKQGIKLYLAPVGLDTRIITPYSPDDPNLFYNWVPYPWKKGDKYYEAQWETFINFEYFSATGEKKTYKTWIDGTGGDLTGAAWINLRDNNQGGVVPTNWRDLKKTGDNTSCNIDISDINAPPLPGPEVNEAPPNGAAPYYLPSTGYGDSSDIKSMYVKNKWSSFLNEIVDGTDNGEVSYLGGSIALIDLEGIEFDSAEDYTLYVYPYWTDIGKIINFSPSPGVPPPYPSIPGLYEYGTSVPMLKQVDKQRRDSPNYPQYSNASYINKTVDNANPGCIRQNNQLKLRTQMEIKILNQDLFNTNGGKDPYLIPIDGGGNPYIMSGDNGIYFIFPFDAIDVSKGWRRVLPYSVAGQTQGNRYIFQGYDKNFKSSFTGSLAFNRLFTKKDGSDAYSVDGFHFQGIEAGDFFLDAYKLNANQQMNPFVKNNDPLDSTIYSGLAIRNGLLDTLVLTGTNLVSNVDKNKKSYVSVTVSGKPYGVGFFTSSENGTEPMINYDAFGKIEKFKIQNIKGFGVNTILKSDKGFQIKFLLQPPPVYVFNTIETPGTSINTFNKNFNYAEGEIVNAKDRNLKQYFRNFSDKTIPYLKNIDVNDPSIPYAYYNNDNKEWLYPIFKNQIPGTVTLGVSSSFFVNQNLYSLPGPENKTKYLSSESGPTEVSNALSSFHQVSISNYPENNFSVYDSSSFYGKGDIVKGEDSSLPISRLYISLISNNQGNELTDPDSWKILDLTGNLSSLYENYFYSTQTTDINFLNYIRDIKNLNNQNLPALVELSVNNLGTKEFCPQPCVLYNLNETYENSFLDSHYFQDINHLFKNPTMLTKEDTSFFISLGNSPLKKTEFYNTGFLQDGGAKTNFLSQYLYFININGQQKKYGKEKCIGGLSITTPSGMVETGADKFDFSNSVLFNFLPCDIDSQDFIKYDVSSGMSTGTSFMVSATDNYSNFTTSNVFPPYGTSYNVLISSKNGTCFTSSYGHFQFSYSLKADAELSNGSQTLSNGTSFVYINEVSTSTFVNTGLSTQGLCYGDIWYTEDSEKIASYGFVIPDKDQNTKSNSLIQLSREIYNGDKLNFITSSGPKSLSLGTSFIVNEFNFDSPQGTSAAVESGTFTTTGSSFSYHIEFKDQKPIDRTSAIFYGDKQIDNAEHIYLPSYDIKQNIKAQAITVFGENFTGDLSYTLDADKANYSLDGKKRATMVFNEFRNDLLLTDIDKRKSEIFAGDKTIKLDNLYKTFIINFKDDTFSLKPNLFSEPIISPESKFLYSGTSSSVDPTLDITAINTESTNVLISEGMTSLKGVSVNINLADFLEFNTKYLAGTSIVPGKTNVQIQLSEIRQNLTSDYIEESNNCNIYFQPQVGQKPTAYTEATWNVIYNSGLQGYKTKTSSSRFEGKFTNNTIIDNSAKTNFYLGCNLSYIIDQSDESNDKSGPMLFSSSPFDIEENIEEDFEGKQKLILEYFINDEKVKDKEQYKKGFYDKYSRYIRFTYQGPFDLTEEDYNSSFVYYGTSSGGINQGGKIKIVYH